jgi:hypothetical protein
MKYARCARRACVGLAMTLATAIACTPTAGESPRSNGGGSGANTNTGGNAVAAGTGGSAMTGTGGGGGATSGNAGSSGAGGTGGGGGSGAGGTAPAGGGGGAGRPTGGGGIAGGAGGAGGVASDVKPAVDSPSVPAGCTAKFCDDFESYAAASVPGGMWQPLQRSGMLAVNEQRAFSGTRSVMFTNQGAANAKTYIELRTPVLPMANNVVHGRLMYYMTRGPTGSNAHWEIVRGSGLLPDGRRAQYNTGGEASKIMFNYEPNDCSKYSKVVFPEKRWACYQWEFDGGPDGAGGTKSVMKLWIDGMPADDVAVTAAVGNCWKAPAMFDTIHIGFEHYHQAQPVELWIDDVAVGDKPIPCPAGPPSKP